MITCLQNLDVCDVHHSSGCVRSYITSDYMSDFRTSMYVMFTIVLGATCVRSYITSDYMSDFRTSMYVMFTI